MFAVNLIPTYRGAELTAFRELWSLFFSHILAPLHSQPRDIIFASDFYGVYQVNPHDFYLLGDVFGLMLRIIYDPGVV